MESFLESVVRRHKEGKKLSEGDIDFLIGVANSSVKLQAENAILREALEKIVFSTGFKELSQVEIFAALVLGGLSK